MRRVCVFCGSSAGDDPAFAHAARELGTALARRGLGLVYGGARVGLMTVLADAALAAGGEVIGVLPRFLRDKELAHPGLTELRLVETMAERKAVMTGLAQAFVALPGGFGTLDEMCETIVAAQLRLHAHPCAFLNVAGYYDALWRFLEGMVACRFLKPQNLERVILAPDIPTLFERLDAPALAAPDKWIPARPDGSTAPGAPRASAA